MSETIKSMKGCALVVEKILRSNRSARNSDKVLVRKTWEAHGLYLSDEQSALFFSKGFPAADTITRAGRKLRHELEELRGTATVEAARSRNEQETTMQMPKTRLLDRFRKRNKEPVL